MLERGEERGEGRGGEGREEGRGGQWRTVEGRGRGGEIKRKHAIGDTRGRVGK